MTQFEAPEQYPGEYRDFDAPLEQRTSGLAIGSLVSSLVCCCPITTILGIILGAAAMVSIRRNPQLKGRGLAIAGIVIGIIATVLQIVTAVSMFRYYEVARDAPYHAMEPGFRSDYGAFRASFGPAGQAATDAEAQAFIEELRSRYGELQRSDIDFQDYQGMQQPQPGQQEVTLPWVLIFDQAVVEAELTFREQDQSPQQPGEIIFHRVRIIDPQQGDLVFPEPSSSP